MTGLGTALERLAEGEVVWVDGSAGAISSFDPHGAWRVNIQDVVRVAAPDDVAALVAAA